MTRQLYAAVITMLIAVPAARAQQPADTVELAPVVITPSRRAAPVDRVTSATTVITGDELRARGTRFVLDALRDVPGAAVVQVGSFGGLTSLFLRGGNSNYVKVLVDGVPMNQSGGAFDFSDLTTADVERIEVVHGPASVIYGSDAVTGVVQIFTRRGIGRAHGTAAAQGGTLGASTLDASVSGGDARAGYSVGIARINTRGSYAFNSHYRNTTLDARMDARPDSLTDAAVTIRYADRTYRFPTDGSGNAVDSNQVSNGDGVTIGLDAGRRLASRLTARLGLALHATDDAFDDRPDGPADSTGFAFASDRLASTSRRSADARLVFRPQPGLSLTAGSQLELERERQSSQTSSDFGGGPATDANVFDAARHTWAGYAEAAAELGHHASLDAGARLDDNSAFGTFVTYRTGASVRLGGTRVRASAGNAYKAPTFSENFAVSPFEVGDPNLRPERSNSWEVGAEQSLARRAVTVGATYFDQRFRQLIQYLSAAPGEPTYANLAAARSRGLEFTASSVPIRGLTLVAQYTWLRTRVTDAGASASPVFALGEQLVRRPAHTGRVGLHLRPQERVSLFANANFVGRRDDVDFRPFPAERVTLPAYHTIEVAAAITVLTGPSRPSLALTARVENLFNAAYESVVGFPGRRRGLLAGARLDF